MEIFFQRIKDRSIKNRKNRILKNYYSKEMRKGKTFRASLVDKLLFFIIIFLGLWFALVLKSGSLLLSLYMSLITSIFLAYAWIFISNRKKVKKIEEINNGLKTKRLIRDLTRMSQEGFINYIKVMLEDYYKIEVKSSSSDIFDLECVIDGENYGIKCIKISMEERVPLREVDLLIKELGKSKVDEGILVTNSYFRDEVNECDNLILIDFNEIKNILMDIDKYPTDEEMENYIMDRYFNRQNNLKTQIKDISIKKIIQLYGVFIIFFILSFFVSYSFYYKLVGVISFLIATIIGGYKISEIIRVDK